MAVQWVQSWIATRVVLTAVHWGDLMVPQRVDKLALPKAEYSAAQTAELMAATLDTTMVRRLVE